MPVQALPSVSFKGNARNYERSKGGAGKAAASLLIPGLGEFLDGRNRQGAIFLGSRLGVALTSVALSIRNSNNFFNAFLKENYEEAIKNSSKYAAPIFALGLAGTGLMIANVVDAYKGGSDKKLDEWE